MEALLAGEPWAVAILESWVRRAAAAYRGRLRHEIEDAVQEALLEIYECLRRGAYTGEGSLRGYVWRLVSHSCLDRLRSLRRWQWVELEPGTAIAEPAAFRRVAAAEETERILRVVAACPAGCRDLWRMILEGKSYREMSERLGVAEGALRVRVLRCRRRAEELAEESGRGL